MNIGEKIETIIFSRKSGLLGDFVAEFQVSSVINGYVVRVDDTTYEVLRNIDIDAGWYWRIERTWDFTTYETDDKYGLGFYNG